MITAEVQQLIFHGIFLLDVAIQHSPYNFNLKTRQILLYNMISCPMKVLDILSTMDVKSVQYDTLGFLFLRVPSEFYVLDKFQSKIQDAMKYYVENYKEIRIVSSKCLEDISCL